MIEVGVQPDLAGLRPEPEGGLGESTAGRQDEVAVNVRHSGRHADRSEIAITRRSQNVRRVAGLDDLPLRQSVQDQPDDPAGTWPHRRGQIGFDAAGEQESARPRVIVDRPLDRTEDLRDFLPFIDQYGFR
jgi:hypothetical protein